jgi:hypothetical protein
MEKIFSTSGKFVFAILSFVLLLLRFHLDKIGVVMIPISTFFVISLFNLITYGVCETFAKEQWKWFFILSAIAVISLGTLTYFIHRYYSPEKGEYLAPQGRIFIEFLLWFLLANFMFAISSMVLEMFFKKRIQKDLMVFQSFQY